jgi:hypothetical protein
MSEQEKPPPNHDPFGPRWVGHGSPPHDPEAERQRIYEYHKANGTLGTYYLCYPRERPWDYGLTPEERAAVLGQSRERER